MKKKFKSKWFATLVFCSIFFGISVIIFFQICNKNHKIVNEDGIKFYFVNELNCKADSLILFKYTLIDSCDISCEPYPNDEYRFFSKEKVIFTPFYKKETIESGFSENTFLPLLIQNRLFGDYYTAFWVRGKKSIDVVFNLENVTSEGHYFFNNKGTPSEIIIFILDKNEENTVYKAICDYNDNNQIIERCYFIQDENENWEFDSRTIYEYGKNMLLETAIVFGSNDSIFTKEFFYYQDIDKKNNWTKRIVKKENVIENYASWQKEVRYIFYVKDNE